MELSDISHSIKSLVQEAQNTISCLGKQGRLDYAERIIGLNLYLVAMPFISLCSAVPHAMCTWR